MLNRTIDPSELYTQRMLVFLEIAPQSNKYRQFLFTEKHFKAVSDAVAKGYEQKQSLPNGLEVFDTLASVDEYELPDLQETYAKRDLIQ